MTFSERIRLLTKDVELYARRLVLGTATVAEVKEAIARLEAAKLRATASARRMHVVRGEPDDAA